MKVSEAPLKLLSLTKRFEPPPHQAFSMMQPRLIHFLTQKNILPVHYNAFLRAHSLTRTVSPAFFGQANLSTRKEDPAIGAWNGLIQTNRFHLKK